MQALSKLLRKCTIDHAMTLHCRLRDQNGNKDQVTEIRVLLTFPEKDSETISIEKSGEVKCLSTHPHLLSRNRLFHTCFAIAYTSFFHGSVVSVLPGIISDGQLIWMK